ncbi:MULTISPECIES: hypothetical protein [unclassified Burkholderia]|uniref:hypothetical protein n=1 Tax=unclassified Burkholderia TaxID=2613784 RepID=UPI0012E3B52E|nr:MULTISPECIES: hypothetical protein [unclassified Burkholderia]
MRHFIVEFRPDRHCDGGNAVDIDRVRELGFLDQFHVAGARERQPRTGRHPDARQTRAFLERRMLRGFFLSDIRLGPPPDRRQERNAENDEEGAGENRVPPPVWPGRRTAFQDLVRTDVTVVFRRIDPMTAARTPSPFRMPRSADVPSA